MDPKAADGATASSLRVIQGPLDLPLARYHIAEVGIGARTVTLRARPTDERHATPFDIVFHGPFAFAGTTLDSPSAAASNLDALVEAGIVAGRVTADHGLEIELMTGDLVASASDRWSVEGTDGRRWMTQPGGGIAVWADDGEREDATAIVDDRSDRDPFDDRSGTPVEVGRGLDLPGAGLHLVGVDVGVGGGLTMTLRPPSAGTPSETLEAYGGPDVMEAFEFFASLNVGPGTVPPDREVFEAMAATIERSDFGLGQDVWIALETVDPSPPETAPALLRSLGSPVTTVRIEPGGRLAVGVLDGPTVSSTAWRLQTSDDERWTASEGEVRHRRWGRDDGALAPGDAHALARAWLDHDRTGRETRLWAWERVNDVIGRQPVTGWLLVRHLIAGAADEGQLLSVAAGPLEDLLSAHSPVLMDRVEAAARSDPRVMRALAGVWKSSIDDDDWDRIQRLLGRPKL